jgi:tRNA 2-thiouridine synthesizing protein B
MATLHIVRKSAFSSNDLAQCLALVIKTDTIVLLDDACYNVNHPLIEQTLSEQPDLAINIMKTHAVARAITVIDSIRAIAMKDLVSLTFTYEKVITWQ